MFRKEFAAWQPYRVNKIATYDLGNNENRIIDWSFLADETLKHIEVSDLTFYGDNAYQEIRSAYATYLGVKPELVAVGVGSDHLIHMIVTSFMAKDDVFLGVNPDFFMYQVYNQLHGSHFESYNLDWSEGTFVLSAEKILERAEEVNAKMIMISNPNNPSSVAYPIEVLEEIAGKFKGLLVVDEAYIEFASVESFISRLENYPNVIVLRTMSKAFGLAGLRLGFAISSSEVIHEINKVMPPFSLSNLTAKMGSIALKYVENVQDSVEKTKVLREEFSAFLQTLPDCHVLPSQTSFVTFTAPWAEQLHQKATQDEWNFKYYPAGALKHYIRLSIGRPDEMAKLTEFIKAFLDLT